MQIITQIIIPLIVAILAVLFEYWVVQPYLKKRANLRLINNIQEVPLQNFIQPYKRELRLLPNNIVFLSVFGINIFDLTGVTQSVKFSTLMPALFYKITNGHKTKSYYEGYHLYSNWKRIEPNALVLPEMSENPIFVLSQYPCYELLEKSDMMNSELNDLEHHKPPTDKEARLEYDYRTILNLDKLSRKVKLVNMKNDKTFYRLLFQCKSVSDVKENGEIILNDQSEVEITILDGYPTKYPHIRITTKVLHPNISPRGDVSFCGWIDTENTELSLASMCLMTIEMLEYHWFDIGSPFNLDAVKKFQYLKSIIPLDLSNLKG